MSHRQGHTSDLFDTERVVVIRMARDDDLPLLHDLAALDGAPPLDGPVLVALVEGRPWAALALRGGHAVADPFLPTTGTISLLRLRAAQLRAASDGAMHGGRTQWLLRRATQLRVR